MLHKLMEHVVFAPLTLATPATQGALSRRSTRSQRWFAQAAVGSVTSGIRTELMYRRSSIESVSLCSVKALFI
jgi:hypothetical protein